MNILVTGAAGYIGSHLVKKLTDYGHQVDGLDNDWSQNDIDKYLAKKITQDIIELNSPISKNYDTVFHLAAKTKVSLSVLDPLSYFKTNIIGTANILNYCSFNHFIYASTGAAYNPNTSPYALSKKAGEDLVRLLDKHTICRFYNVSGNDGFMKFDDGYYHIVRTAAAAANKILPHVTINGNDYETPDGTTIRNYTHIKDIVDSLVRINDYGNTNNIECLGNTTGYSVLEVINAMKKVSGCDFKVLYGPRRDGDSVRSVLPNQSKFFIESNTLEDQCISALNAEIK